jgi:RNA polymerase sigma factor (sigma-70 family)
MNVAGIVEKYNRQLKQFIRSRVATDEDAEDILQNVFYKLSKADMLLLPVENVLAWLYTVTRNQITDLWRKKKPDTILADTDDEDDEIYSQFESILFDESDNPEQVYFRSLILDEIDAALAELPPEQREAFEMTEFQGLSFKELSEKTGVRVNTLLSRKRYAILHLRERLAELYYELFI